MDLHSSWKLLTNVPNAVFHDNIRNSLFAIKNKTGVVKYYTDSWTKYQIKSSLNEPLLGCSSHDRTNAVYLFHEPNAIIKFQIMNNNEINMEKIMIKIDIPALVSVINIKDERHIIGGHTNNNKHIKY